MAQTVKSLPAVWEIWVGSLGQEDPLEKEMANHSSILAWRILWKMKPRRLQSIGLHGGQCGHGRGRGWGSSTSRLPLLVQFSSVQSLSRVRLFATPWTAARQASLSITNSRSSLRFTSIESVMPSSHPLSSPSPPAPNPSQHQSLFQWVNCSHEMAKILEFQPQHQSFQWTPRTGLL